MFVMVLFSIIGLFFYTTRFQVFFLIFEHNCMFSGFILLPCQIIILLNSPIEGKHSREHAQLWEKAYLDMLIVLVI